jgi:hypothetical protein
MRISREYGQLMDCACLPERFQAGDYSLDGEEKAVLKEFIDGFYDSVKENGCVPLDDFFEFMDFLDSIWCGDTEEVTEVAAYTFLNSAKLHSAVEKQRQDGEQTASGQGDKKRPRNED